MESHSNITKWFIGISIFIAFSIGVGAGLGLPIILASNNSESVVVEIPKISPINNNLVLGYKSNCINGIETEAGEIRVNTNNIADVELPLCLTEDSVPVWNALIDYSLLVCGGYVPEESIVDVKQIAGTWEEAGPKIVKGQLKITWAEDLDWVKPEGYCCCWKKWDATFVWIADICLNSIHNPAVPACWELYGSAWCLAKLVDFEIETEWIGCWFYTIPSSDLYFSEFPTLKNLDFS